MTNPPLRILHLIDQASKQACPTTLALLATSYQRIKQAKQRVLLLGGKPLEQIAQQAGLENTQRLGVPFGQAIFSWPAMMAQQRKQVTTHDLIHCWSIASLSVASLMWRQTPKLLTLTQAPTKREIHWLRLLLQEATSPTILLSMSTTIARELLSGGLSETCVHVLRPGLEMAKVAHDQRQNLRKRWNVTGDNAKVICLIDDPPTSTDARLAGLAASLAIAESNENIGPIYLLVSENQNHLLSTQQNWEPLGLESQLLTDPQHSCPWAVLPGCDVALSFGENAGGLSLLWAMAANVPIVSEARYATSEVIEDRHSALLTLPDNSPSLAHQLHKILSDKQLAWKLKDTARHEAYSFFSAQTYCQSLQQVYQQLIDRQPIEIPQPEVTGGMRFSGRV